MFPGINPKQMQAAMKQMGISQTEIDASRVIIEKADGGKIIIEPANVVKIKMQGEESFQVTGEIREEEEEVQSEEESKEADIKTIIEKTGCSKKQAEKALDDADGDLAEAILELSS
jgi:nascent polypeptide-associated complex subunit alpha